MSEVERQTHDIDKIGDEPVISLDATPRARPRGDRS